MGYNTASFVNHIKYAASEFINRHADFFGTGVINPGSDFLLTYPGGMVINVSGSGTAWSAGTRYGFDGVTPTALTFAANASGNPRIDLIEIGLATVNVNLGLSQNISQIIIKQGTPGSSPVQPTPDTGFVGLYAVSVPAGATSLTSANITDLRTRVTIFGFDLVKIFDGTLGHKHTGATGDGPKIAGSGLSVGAAVTNIGYIPLNQAGDTLTAGTITLYRDPINPMEAVTKEYADALAQGLSPKNVVRIATTGSNITLSGLQTIDGIALVVGDRVLVKDQTTQSQNGIYLAGTGLWTRSLDAATGPELVGAFVFVDTGTVNADSAWFQQTIAPITIGTTNIVWGSFQSATQITATGALQRIGNAISIISGSITSAMLATGAAVGNIANGTITALMLATGVAIANLGYTPLNKAGDAITGAFQQPAPVALTIVSNTITLPTTSNRFVVSGTGPVNSITGFTGGEIEIRWNSVVTLTNSASLILTNGGINRTTAVGDIGYYGFDSAGVVRETGYTSAIPNGNPTGAIISVLSKNTPVGYIKGNGAALSRTVYSNLLNNSFCSIQTTGNTTSGNAIITNIATTIDMAIGMPIEGSGIPAGSTIASINSLASITISANATATATGVAIIAFPYGNGDGSTTYNVPDLRGEHLRAFDDGRNADTTALSGVVTSASTAITGLTYTGFMFVGMPISGTGIPAGSTVASITSTTAITINASATASSTTTLTFTGRRFGSWENHDLLSHNHSITGSAYSGNASTGGGLPNPIYGSGSTPTTSTGGAETRGRNYAVPVYIKY